MILLQAGAERIRRAVRHVRVWLQATPRSRLLLLDAVLLGVVGALAALLFWGALRLAQHVFLEILAGYRPPGLPAEGGVLLQHVGPHGLWLVPVATTLGGLISGLLVYTWAPEAEGHGTDTVVRAFHRRGGLLRARVVPIKTLASAITIGSGGAAGREGPTALIAAGVGSVYATWLRRSDDERRLLVLVGMAAGLSAIFRSPIGTAVFAIEVLYRSMEFEAKALVYALLASIVAYTLTGTWAGWSPLFTVPTGLVPTSLTEYASYATLGVLAGVVGAVLPVVFYRARDAFQMLPLPAALRPALGGLGVGLLGMAVPQVLGGGYGWIQEAIDGRLAFGLLSSLVLLKLVAFSLTISSGGSGGVFAPGLFVGAMLGGTVAALLGVPPAGFVTVGMAAVFAAAAHTPIATLLMVTEMTGGYELLVPAALAVLVAVEVQSALTRDARYPTLYEAQVESRSDSPAHFSEHVSVALRLLLAAETPLEGVGRIELAGLLRSSVPVELPDGGRLLLLAAAPATDAEPGLQDGDEVVAVLRDGHLLPRDEAGDTREKDRLLAVRPAASEPSS